MDFRCITELHNCIRVCYLANLSSFSFCFDRIHSDNGPGTSCMSIGYRSVPSTGLARQVLPVHALLPHKLSRVTSSSQQCHRGCSGQSALDTTWTLHSEYCPARQCTSQHRRAPTDRTVTSRPYDDIQLPAHSQQLKPAAENDIQQLGQ